MIEVKTFHKILRNLTSLQVRDPTTVERERNAQKKTAVLIDKITIAAQKESNCKIGTLMQGTPLLAIPAMLLAIILPTIKITLPLANASIPKSVVVTVMIETIPTTATCETTPHTTITAEIAHPHPMPTLHAEMHLMIDNSMSFLKKPPKKF
jgi:hypothetical protein